MPEVAAEALFVEGRRLMRLGQYDEACAKFRESQRLDAAAGTLMNLALCYKLQGRTASAWSTYRHAAAAAALHRQAARERVARREAAALEKQLATLAVRLPLELRGKVQVTFDGARMSPALIAIPTPVDPGAHEVHATASGRTVWSTRLSIAAGERVEVTVPRDLLDEPKVEAFESRWSALHTAAAVQAGVAIVAAGVGAALAVSARADYSEGGEHCFQNVCEPAGFRLRERAIHKARLATVSFTLAGAASAGAGLLWLSAPSLRSPRSSGAPRAWSVTFSSVW